MNYYRMNPLLKGSGGMVETILWENPDRSSVFNGQTITLSDSVKNYDYIAVYFAAQTSYPTEEKQSILNPYDITRSGGSVIGYALSSTVQKNSSTYYTRYITRPNQESSEYDNKLVVSNAMTTTTGTGAKDNNYAIPIKVVGLTE